MAGMQTFKHLFRENCPLFGIKLGQRLAMASISLSQFSESGLVVPACEGQQDAERTNTQH